MRKLRLREGTWDSRQDQTCACVYRSSGTLFILLCFLGSIALCLSSFPTEL